MYKINSWNDSIDNFFIVLTDIITYGAYYVKYYLATTFMYCIKLLYRKNSISFLIAHKCTLISLSYMIEAAAGILAGY